MSRPPRIVLSAGELSGDRLGAGLAEALLRRRPELELVGMGGPRMEAAGVRLVQQQDEVAVVGFGEVLAHLPAIRRAMRRLRELLQDDPPDLLVPIDYQEFNMRLAATAKGLGIPVVYYVSPQIWAWRRGRVKKVAARVKRMMVLFPFEAAFYEEAGVPVSHVGHPVVEPREDPPTRAAFCEPLGLDPERPICALMPGSRRSEVGRLLPVLLDAAALLKRPELQFVMPVAPGLDDTYLDALVAGRAITRYRGDFHHLLAHAALGAVASGTASLECAVAGLPVVVAYRVSGFSSLLGRFFLKVDHIALPNLILGERVLPEQIQGDCTPEKIAAELARYLDDPGYTARVKRRLGEVVERLGGPGVFERAADAVLAELEAG